MLKFGLNEDEFVRERKQNQRGRAKLHSSRKVELNRTPGVKTGGKSAEKTPLQKMNVLNLRLKQLKLASVSGSSSANSHDLF